MEKYPNENNQPETAYDTPKLFEWLRDLSAAEIHTLRTDATETYNEVATLIKALDCIERNPDQYEIDLGVGDGEDEN